MTVSQQLACGEDQVAMGFGGHIRGDRRNDVGERDAEFGQLPMVSGALPATGKVGDADGLVPPADAKSYARQCALNAISAAAAAIGGVDRLTGVVKVVGFVASVPEFTGQPGVINGASEVLGEIFGDAGRHARSAVGVPVLPLDAPVEVEVVFSYA